MIMNVFIFPILQPKTIYPAWLEELFPEASAVKAIEILEASVQNPKCVLLGVFHEKTKVMKGFLWGEGNELDSSLFVNSIYVEKSHRRNPKIVGSLLDHIKENYKRWGYKRVLFLTRKPKFFLKRDCKPFEETCVKLELEDD